MRIDIFKIIIPVISCLCGWKAIFYFFNPSEVWTIVAITVLLFIAYGIQLVEWAETDDYSIFGISVYQRATVKQQWTAFGIIPLWRSHTVYRQTAIFHQIDLTVLIPIAVDKIKLFIPFAGYKSIATKK